ncbi:glutathione S-transferase family protein [Lentisphaera profundi]|uniref:Glutathione S-transferase family protein n=1 Tax=Lentisphaera profundi TaxID=1658616 RepID=A0ABY7VXU2_9BACT|nr:glutathione S-transferase family protein [Lentisphaera profundi]WDE98985.1 glutathione S-transferase family protein [Lentisphaera profundi]
MGLLIDGQWKDQWYDTKSSQGRFVRAESQFRNWVTKDGSPGPSGTGGFKAEAGRYHLYLSYACPWAHRAIIFRKLKGLEDMISISVVHWYMADKGWTFADGEGVIPDAINNADLLHQIYTAADPSYTGRVTVPILWDKKTKTIVNNESSEIIRIFNSAFDEIGALPGDYYPNDLQGEIDTINESIYHNVNNGVYKAGFATTQDSYEDAVQNLFTHLDKLEGDLSKTRYLVGEKITEADWRLFTTLVRFDAVYVGHFKCNIRRLADYPNLWNYTRELYQITGIQDTVFMDHIKKHYYESHATINPTGIVPSGPNINFLEAHNRESIK